MKRYSFAYPLLVMMFFVACKRQVDPSDNRGAQRPNVILVLTDDQGYGDVGFHGNTLIKTPHLDALAQEATELSNFHVGTTCAPTRAGLMTGRNSNRNNVWHTIGGCSILNREEETMAEVFQKNGYQTAMFGKWHLGDNYPYRPQDRGFQEALYHGGGGVGQTPDYWNNNYFDDTYFRNGKPEKFEGYCTDVWFSETLAYIDRQKDRPFLAYLALNAPHGPYNVPQKYLDLYAGAPLTDTQKRFYGMITNFDENLGRLIAELKANGQWDNTIFIFMTDNGTAAGIAHNNGKTTGYNGGLRGTKGSQYDGGHRVPFLISWPAKGITSKNQKSNNDLFAHVDLLPTLATLCGLDFEPKNHLDGQDMSRSLLEGQGDTERMLVVDTQRNQWPEKYRNSCVMQGEWRLVNGNELYDLKDDLGQENNIAEAHPDKVEAMQAFYEKWWDGTEADMHYAHIPLTSPDKGPVLLTTHDLHSEEAIPWNQNLIRKGEQGPDGYYSVEVREEGEYRFDLYRYPPESGWAIDASVPEIPSRPNIDGLAAGKGMTVRGAEIEIGEKKLRSGSGNIENHVEVTANLQKGAYKLRANFLVDDGKTFPAYYLRIIKK